MIEEDKSSQVSQSVDPFPKRESQLAHGPIVARRTEQKQNQETKGSGQEERFQNAGKVALNAALIDEIQIHVKERVHKCGHAYRPSMPIQGAYNFASREQGLQRG